MNIDAEVVDLEIGGTVSAADLDLVLPQGTVVKVYPDEAITPRGAFKTRGKIHIIGENGEPEKIFRGDLNEFYRYQQQRAGRPAPAGDAGPPADEPGGDSTARPTSWSQMTAQLLIGLSLATCVWIVVRFVQIAYRGQR